MTYLEYLLLFIIFPIIVASWYLVRSFRESSRNTIIDPRYIIVSLVILSIIAFLYTTPWDNYLVASGIWSYKPNQILGIIIGYVPIEEYSFFILETILVGLLTFIILLKFPIKIPETMDYGITKEKLILLGYFFVIWVTMLVLFVCDYPSYKYMSLILVWALPPIVLQLLVGWDIIFTNFKKILALIVTTGFYLSVTDFIAISLNIWEINANYIINLNIGVLPFEEILFFYVTTILITFGTILFNYYLKMRLERS